MSLHLPKLHSLETTVKFKLNLTKISIYQHVQNQEIIYDLLAKFIQLLVHKEIQERDLTMPFDHPTQLCQGKFTIKDEKVRISSITSCSSDNSSRVLLLDSPHFNITKNTFWAFHLKIKTLLHTYWGVGPPFSLVGLLNRKHSIQRGDILENEKTLGTRLCSLQVRVNRSGCFRNSWTRAPENQVLACTRGLEDR